MFTQQFDLKFNPFDKEIPTEKLFSSRDSKELDSRLKYMLDSRGICLLVGEPGSGKSTALRKLCDNLNRSLYKPCYLPLTTLTVKEFYQAMAALLGETPKYKKFNLFQQIQDCIYSMYYEQRITPVIIVDELCVETHNSSYAEYIFMQNVWQNMLNICIVILFTPHNN